MISLNKYLNKVFAFKIGKLKYKGSFKGVGHHGGNYGMVFANVTQNDFKIRSYLLVPPRMIKTILSPDSILNLRKECRKIFIECGFTNICDSIYFSSSEVENVHEKQNAE